MNLQLDKNRIANSFSKAAVTYDGSAALQKAVGNELLQQMVDSNVLSANALRQSTILDLGSGTGFFSHKLNNAYPSTDLICLDIAQGMLKHARKLYPQPKLQWLCADAESLPLADNSVDVIFSSLAIQWCENIEMLFSEIARVLKINGRAFIATLGPESLFELKQAWAAVDDKTHVNTFVNYESILQRLPINLSALSCRQQTRVVEYDKLQELTADLKNIGAHNMNPKEAKGLTGRRKIKAFKQNYECYRQENGHLPASYEVYYFEFQKTHCS